ncbi:uncharacterized protein LOC113003657 [Solenopsis invicta]|uniref:uncharacterized protein LOC113003657 n=1 Tax=Solenopsis invicta TaxID=13686 RepID=UPI00193EBBA7|nr:uncharacterized protein LOC113003657 [Solenopsis invicta]
MNRETLDRTLTISTRTRVLPGIVLLTMINEHKGNEKGAKREGVATRATGLPEILDVINHSLKRIWAQGTGYSKSTS